jgi:hypothetical protein
MAKGGVFRRNRDDVRDEAEELVDEIREMVGVNGELAAF